MKGRYLFILGFVLGIYSALIAFYWRLEPDFGDGTNAVIAISTVVAACLTYSSIRVSIYSRVWDTNKEEIFTLLSALSDIIMLYEEYIDAYWRERGSECIDMRYDSQLYEKVVYPDFKDASKRLNASLSRVENVFFPLLPEEFVGLMKEYRTVEQKIERAYDGGACDHGEAHAGLLDVTRRLRDALRGVMVDFSGIKFLSRRFFRS